MTEQEKEVLKRYILEEEAIRKKLIKAYKEALVEIRAKIAELQGRGLQSKIYQLKYQQKLEKEITAILAKLKNIAAEDIEKYLSKAYQSAYIGTAYKLSKYDIIVTTTFLNELAISKSVLRPVADMIFSQRLYKAMDQLKAAVISELSRGISTGTSYGNIARQLGLVSEANFNQALRIVRTEGGRIQSEAQLEAMRAAAEEGADLVKVWDSTLDSNTRESHRALDQTYKDLEEPFEVSGYKAMAPRLFGVAAQDINCRCAMLEKPRWAVDPNAENQRVDNETGEIVTAKNFEEYEKNYIEKRMKDAIIEKAKEKEIVMSKHIKERMKERSFTEEDIYDAVLKSLESKYVKQNKTFRFIGNVATININPKTFKATTGWKTGKREIKRLKKKYGIS
ncbi:MAG: phage minor head protein [Anaerovoracaceae bacterium]